MKALTLAATLAAWALSGCEDTSCFRDAGLACSVCEEITEPAVLEIGGGDYETGFLELEDGAEMVTWVAPNAHLVLPPSIRALGVYPGAEGGGESPADPAVEVRIYAEGMQVGGICGGGLSSCDPIEQRDIRLTETENGFVALQ